MSGKKSKRAPCHNDAGAFVYCEACRPPQGEYNRRRFAEHPELRPLKRTNRITIEKTRRLQGRALKFRIIIDSTEWEEGE